MKPVELEKLFESKGQIRGGTLYLSVKDAIELVERARAERIRVLGIDGFNLGPSSTEPLLEHSIDLSAEKGVGSSWDDALQFLRSRGSSSLAFEVVLD